VPVGYSEGHRFTLGSGKFWFFFPLYPVTSNVVQLQILWTKPKRPLATDFLLYGRTAKNDMIGSATKDVPQGKTDGMLGH
jgi:hypothetical protein